MAWNAGTYLAFGDHRTRPAYELIARVLLEAPRLVCDLGCGPGNSTRALQERWPEARLIGVDNSREMLAAAREQGPEGAEWQFADIAEWTPSEAPDLIFSNAAFQWVGGQHAYMPKLLASLAPGGVFAFQIPANHQEPPHTIIDEVLKEMGLAERVADVALSRHVFGQADYFRMLEHGAETLDIWDTTYLQVLTGEDAVLRWIRGTALLPIMEALKEPDMHAFLERLRERLNAHYPPESNGVTLFPFRRRFIVARRG